MPATADDCSKRVSDALPRRHGALARRCSDCQSLTSGDPFNFSSGNEEIRIEKIRNLAWADLAGDLITLKMAESITVDFIEATGQQNCDAKRKEAVHKVARNATVSIAKLRNIILIVYSLTDGAGPLVLAHAAATAVGRGRLSQADAHRSRAMGSVPGPPRGSSLERAHSLRGNSTGCL